MQGINWVSKELKKSFITHKLDKMNSTCIKLIEYMRIIYSILIIEAFFNNKKEASILFSISLLLSLFIMKNLKILKVKA